MAIMRYANLRFILLTYLDMITG